MNFVWKNVTYFIKIIKAPQILHSWAGVLRLAQATMLISGFQGITHGPMSVFLDCASERFVCETDVTCLDISVIGEIVLKNKVLENILKYSSNMLVFSESTFRIIIV